MEKPEKIEHILVPEHRRLNKDEVEEVLKKYNVSKKQLPKILKTDPAIRHDDPERGDVYAITRDSPTSGKSVFYRVVV
ncbi:MAG: DNA-directed RNA polymerase subunit H [archaeon]